jgi:hypothetical protein
MYSFVFVSTSIIYCKTPPSLFCTDIATPNRCISVLTLLPFIPYSEANIIFYKLDHITPLIKNPPRFFIVLRRKFTLVPLPTILFLSFVDHTTSVFPGFTQLGFLSLPSP